MRRAPILRLTSVFGLVMLLAGCGTSAESPGESDPVPAPETTSRTTATTSAPTVTSPAVTPGDPGRRAVTMTGTIEDGVESGCLVFTDEATGESYSITSDQLPDTARASRVTVTGTVDPEMMSFCMQGPILLVDEVTPAPSP